MNQGAGKAAGAGASDGLMVVESGVKSMVARWLVATLEVETAEIEV